VTLDCEVVTTRLGARAIRDRITGELMHPVVGPSIEAERLYVGPSRLADRLAIEGEPLILLDVGLGAASNAIAAWRRSEARSRGRRLEIVSFDRSVAALELALEPAHRAAFGLDGAAGDAARALLDRGAHETARTSWRLVVGDGRAALDAEPAGRGDVVFWDPFSPRANPEMWTLGVFASLRRLCRAGATIHTYSRATSVRTALALAELAVGEGVVLDNGRATTIAATRIEDLEAPLPPSWIDRLPRSTAPFPPDAPSDALARMAALDQFRAR
jgi:queuine tRNA-ribosyltransferase